MRDYSTYSTETLKALYTAYNLNNDYSSYCQAQAIRKELNNRKG